LLVVPECDLLSEQSLELANRLRAAAVPVELKLYGGATHSFLEAVSISPLADRAFADTATWLRASLWPER
jgi:acetyl esterase